MPQNHWSDCSLHNGPAIRPTWCDCGGVDRKPTFREKISAWLAMNWLYATGRL